MFMAFMTLVIFASAPVLGGRLGRMRYIRLRYPLVIVAALAVQVLTISIFPGAPKSLLVPLNLATYAAAAVVLWANRSIPGLIILGVGAILNGGVIALNGGTLPARAQALATAGWHPNASNFNNSDTLAHPILPWLGDIVATPGWLPFRNVMSIGDMTILLGVLIFAHGISHSYLAVGYGKLTALVRRRRPADGDEPGIGSGEPVSPGRTSVPGSV
jgi:hypothetical protein